MSLSAKYQIAGFTPLTSAWTPWATQITSA
jgi:hypothetical protein